MTIYLPFISRPAFAFGGVADNGNRLGLDNSFLLGFLGCLFVGRA
jgi:hypothetical protein